MCSCQENLVGCEWPEAKSSLLLPGASIERGLQRCGHWISSTRPVIPQVGASEWTNWSDAVATKADARVQTVCCVPRISNLYIRCIALCDFSHDNFHGETARQLDPRHRNHPRFAMYSAQQRGQPISWVILGRGMFQPRRSQGPCPLLGQNPSHVVSGSEKRKEPQRTTKNHKEPQRRTKIINMIKSSPSPSPSSWNNQK